MQPGMNVVARGEIAAHHALKLLPYQVSDRFPAARMVIFVVADRGSGDAPDVAVAAIFSPAGFICLHRWAGADLCFETREHRLRILCDAMQQFHQFPETDLKAMQI